MLFINVNKAAGDRLIDHFPSNWRCFGEHTMRVEYKDTADMAYAHAIFDMKSQEVMYISVEVPGQPQAFQWINPDYKTDYYKECTQLDIDPQIAWDNINFTNVETEDLILEYLKDIGEGYYDNLPIVDTIPTLTDVVEYPPEAFTMPMPGTVGSATYTFPEEQSTKKSYTVKLDVRMVFDVDAESMDEAVANARAWQETSKTQWGKFDNVSWVDHYIVKEAVEKQSQD